ncbi:MAG: hypothetical protein M0P71_14930 [Melioribacteraceae bacterium]|nr:hypothetical protein [Melioribacteraceae bacterium]
MAEKIFGFTILIFFGLFVILVVVGIFKPDREIGSKISPIPDPKAKYKEMKKITSRQMKRSRIKEIKSSSRRRRIHKFFGMEYYSHCFLFLIYEYLNEALIKLKYSY